MTKCSMDEYGRFEYVFWSINKKWQEINNSKIKHYIENFISQFHLEHHFRA